MLKMRYLGHMMMTHQSLEKYKREGLSFMWRDYEILSVLAGLDKNKFSDNGINKYLLLIYNE